MDDRCIKCGTFVFAKTGTSPEQQFWEKNRHQMKYPNERFQKEHRMGRYK